MPDSCWHQMCSQVFIHWSSVPSQALPFTHGDQLKFCQPKIKLFIHTVSLSSMLPNPRAEFRYTTPFLPKRICVVTLWQSWKYSHTHRTEHMDTSMRTSESVTVCSYSVSPLRQISHLSVSSKPSRTLLYTVKINTPLWRTAEKGPGKLHQESFWSL